MDELKSGSWSDSKGLARAILHDRAERRKWLGRIVVVPVLMIAIGVWGIEEWVWGSLWRAILWWGGCAIATVVVILFALLDALMGIREEREKGSFES